MCRFLPKYSGGQVIKIIKSISGKRVFENAPEIKEELWGGEFWTDGYYIATISGKGNKEVIEKYIRSQGREVPGSLQKIVVFCRGGGQPRVK
jgi:putative transposase